MKNKITKELLLTDYPRYINKVKKDIFQNDDIIDTLKLLHQQYHPAFPENRFMAHNKYLIISNFYDRNVSLRNSDSVHQHPKLIFIHIPKNGGTSYDSYFKDIYKDNTPHYLYMIDDFFFNSWEHNIEYFNFPLLKDHIVKLNDQPKDYIKKGWFTIPENAITGIMYQNKAYFDKYATTYSHIHICTYNMSTNSNIVIDNIDYYIKQNSKIFIMLRDPINRIISEYNFFMEYAKENPFDLSNQYIIETMLRYDSFKSYIYQSNCHNYQLGFIYGNRWQINYIYTSEQIDCIKKMIIEKKIFVGILEYPECNKNLCQHMLSTKYESKIKLLNKNTSKLKFSRNDISDKDIEYLYEKNKEDYEIYNFALQYLKQNY